MFREQYCFGSGRNVSALPLGAGFNLTPKTDPLVSLVIPSHMRSVKLAATILAIADQDYDNYELVLVDSYDDETTRFLSVLASLDLPIERVYQKEEWGVAEARNAGIDTANGEIVVFTDDDCVPPPHWLSSIVAVFERYDVVSVGGVKLPHERVADRLAAKVDDSRTRCNQVPPDHLCDEYGVAIGGAELRTFDTANLALKMSVLEETGERFKEGLTRGSDAEFHERFLSASAGQTAFLPVPVAHNRDYTFSGFLHTRFKNGISEANTETGRTLAGSLSGLGAAPVLLLTELVRQRSTEVAIGAWIGDLLARFGVIVGSASA